jgi:hypothetical protein
MASNSNHEFLTLDQIAERILLPAYQRLTPEQRKTITFDSVMRLARTPVGGLKTKGAN